MSEVIKEVLTRRVMGVILGVIVARNFYVLYVFQQLYVLYMLFSSHMLQGAVRGY